MTIEAPVSGEYSVVLGEIELFEADVITEEMKQVLSVLIDELTAMDKTDYTASSIAKLEEVLLKAKSALENTSLSLEAYEAVLEELKTAEKNLKVLLSSNMFEDIEDVVYTGQVQKFAPISIKDDLVSGTDFKVAYSQAENNYINASESNIKVIAIGIGDRYTGTATIEYKITAATPSVTIGVEKLARSIGDNVRLTANVTGVATSDLPEGMVTFTSGDVEIAEVKVVNGVAITDYKLTTDGKQEITATFVATNGGNYIGGTGTTEFNFEKEDQAPLIMTAIPEKTEGDASFTLTTTGGDGKGLVTFVSSSPSVIRIDGSTATVVGVGSSMIIASKAGDIDYNPAVATPVTVAVKPQYNGGGDNSNEYTQTDFWTEAESEIQNSEAGDIISINTGSYDKLSWSVMEALREKGDVAIVIKWDGGEDIVIPAGAALPREKGRIFWPLSLLSEMYKESVLVTEDGVNPTTGGTLYIQTGENEMIPVTGEVKTIESPIVAAGGVQETIIITPADSGIETATATTSTNNNSSIGAIAKVVVVALGAVALYWNKKKQENV